MQLGTIFLKKKRKKYAYMHNDDVGWKNIKKSEKE